MIFITTIKKYYKHKYLIIKILKDEEEFCIYITFFKNNFKKKIYKISTLSY